jgi:uncharacterized protein YkwD
MGLVSPVGGLLICIGVMTAAVQDSIKLSNEEQKILDLTNAERKKEKLPPLKADAKLTAIARSHAANMARQGKMEHQLDGKSPFDRIKVAGYKYAVAGENIARGDVTLTEIFAEWMRSKKHRENILDDEFTEIGIGFAKDDKGETYYVQVFAHPRK